MRAYVGGGCFTVPASDKWAEYHNINIMVDEDVRDVLLHIMKKDRVDLGSALEKLIEFGAIAYDRIGGYNIEEDNEKIRKRRGEE